MKPAHLLPPSAVMLGMLATVPPLSAQHTLHLQNGDRLSGRFVGVRGATWLFAFEGSVLTIPVATVTGLEVPETIGVRLQDGTITAATIAPAPNVLSVRLASGELRMITPAGIAAVGDPDDLATLAPPVVIGLFTPFTRFWSGSGNLGASDKRGNSKSRGITASIEVMRRSPKDRIRLQAGFDREDAEDQAGEFVPVVAKAFGSFRTDAFFTGRLFAFVETRHERDTFQDLARRSTYGGGLGWQLVATATTDLNFAASGGARVERFIADGSASAAVVKPSLALRQHLGPVRLEWEVNTDANVRDLSDFQSRSHASFTTTVYRGLGVRLSFRNEFNNAPRPGVRKHDMLITTTLAYSIGQ